MSTKDTLLNFTDPLFLVYEFLKKKNLGGIVIADLDAPYDCLISARTAQNNDFSIEFIQKYKLEKTQCFGFQGSTDLQESMTCIKKNIGPENNDAFTNLESYIQDFHNIFLNMDIEGGEWQWLQGCNTNNLAKFAQISIELHGITNTSWHGITINSFGCGYEEKRDCLEKLAQTHYLVHAHGNNADRVASNGLPNVLQLIYINKNLFKDIPPINTQSLPICGLDNPTESKYPDIDLNFFPFVLQTNPFLLDLEEKAEYNATEFGIIQTQMNKINVDAIIDKLYTAQNNFYTRCDFRNRISRGLQQTLIETDKGYLPQKHLYKLGDGGDGTKCFVCCVPFVHLSQGKENNTRFVASQQILRSLEVSGFQGYFYLFTGGFPNPTGSEMKYAGVPYSFKIFMMLEAEKKGFTKVIWIDSGCYALNNPEPLFAALDTVLARTVVSGNHWKSMTFAQTLRLLNYLTGTNLEDATYVETIVFGLNLQHTGVKSIIREYYEMVKLGWPFFSIFPEEVVLSAILHKPEYKHLLPINPINKILQIHEKYKTEPQARAEGFYFHHKDYTKYTDKNHYKFIVLIIDSDGESCYDGNRKIMSQFMNSNKNIQSFFIRMRLDQAENVQLEGDTIFCKGKESFIPGILDKTLAAMKFCLQTYSFDYLIRTNLSSFWNLDELLNYSTTLPHSSCVSAMTVRYTEQQMIGSPYYNIVFPSGAGIIFSHDIIKLLCSSATELLMNLPDDVAIGKFLLDHSIPIIESRRLDLIENSGHVTQEFVQQQLIQKHFHYRVKGWDRQYDTRNFQYLYNAIYKKSYKATLVSFYFNLSILPDATPEVRPQSFYMEKGRETLKIENPLLIFCDESTYPLIKSMRDEYIHNQDLTRYIIRPLTDYDFYKDNHSIIQRNRKGVPCYESDRITSSYFLATLFKIYALKIAYEKNFFDTPFYTWIDFGGSHILRHFGPGTQRILDNPRPKISFCYIHYRSHEELQDRIVQKNQGGYCGIASGCLTIEADYINKFYTGCISIFYEMLFHGVGHAEEQIFNYFYDRHPELCDIYYGDYYSILTNYHHPVEDYNSIKRFFIEEAIRKGRADLAKECAKSILVAVNKGLLKVEDITYLQRLAV